MAVPHKTRFLGLSPHLVYDLNKFACVTLYVCATSEKCEEICRLIRCH
jgi:hypothetical protein